MPMSLDTSTYRYHAHIYFLEDTRDAAWALREEIEANFSPIDMGRFHEKCVGPHPRWSFQVAFNKDISADFIDWLMLNRKGLTIFLHPQTGNDLEDHRDNPLWMGETLELNLDVFE